MSSNLRKMIDQNRQQEREKYLRDYQQRSGLAPEALAEHLNRRCPHCDELLTPTFQPDLWRGGNHRIAIWPDSHDCEAERQARAWRMVQEMAQQEAAWSKEYQHRLEVSGLTGWLGRATFDSFEARPDFPGAADLKNRVMAYAQAIGQGKTDKPTLILYGWYGNGKSHLAASVIRYCVDLEIRPCYFRIWSDYLKRIQATYGPRNEDDDRETEADIIAELQTGRVVVIDDLDKRRHSGFVRDTLYEVVNYRYNHELPTILTFNYGPDDADPKAPGRPILETYLGRAVLDRILDTHKIFDIIEFTGPSFRNGMGAV